MRKIFKFGDNIDTDSIIPGQYCGSINAKDLAKYCMYNIYDNFNQKVNKGDILLAGNNFGCGSSREMAPLALKESGIEIIIAKSFSRIFMRNSINIGLQLIQDINFYDFSNNGDKVIIDGSLIINITNGAVLEMKNQDNSVLKKIIASGGIMKLIQKVQKGEEEI